MVPEDRAKCWSWAAGEGPAWEPRKPHVPWGRVLAQDPRGGHDQVDGQILGQLRTLAEEEEEEEGAGASSPPGAACPGMGSEELRLASFYDWPLTAGVRPEPLAAAGFFHTGQQDKVRCFFCYGGLQSWERGDDPWTEHAKWFPRCQFLLRSKGRDFVHSIQESGSQLLGPWDLWEEPEDTAPASPSGPVHQAPELLTPRTEPWLESAREPGAGAGAVAMEEQLRRLQEERTCKVCLDQAVSVVFVPCGHLVCTQCAPNLHLCPICRAPVRSCVRTFLS
ncbi:baculoviral IAP repeat-containing protein 7 [Oryctolagus cuniculus]|uniref:RING-type E3 ubiquitin transferase n=1 Tax=Oryctolagus cuniculus TaxID=9986 RepID=G1SJF7_RABIT|nr:baculoviral IAP repeat-containing protein 7 [Oryctolagus cuniculus]XP_008251650.1 baculoviral IAP repeat-containing protein 7 [Oryctolagus cuniculus]